MKASNWVRVVLVAVIGVAIAVAVHSGAHFDPDTLETWLQGAGFAAPAVFVVAYAFTAVVFLPGWVPTEQPKTVRIFERMRN